jgi:hypothetical protein
MINRRFAKPMSVATAFLVLYSVPGLSRVQSSPPASVSSPAQPKKNSPPPDDFAGFDYTEEQKTEIDQIHKDSKSRIEVVAKDQKLTVDQKDAMILGYSRMEYGQIYKVLTPEQRRHVQQRIRARRAEDEAAKKKQVSRK